MNAMIDREDPRLTAYALGELKGSERKAFEAELRQDPSALKEVDAIQKLGALLEDELDQEPCPRLDEVSRRAIEVKARQAKTLPEWAEPVDAPVRPRGERISFFRKAPPRAFAAAAAVMLAGGLGIMLLTTAKNQSRMSPRATQLAERDHRMERELRAKEAHQLELRRRSSSLDPAAISKPGPHPSPARPVEPKLPADDDRASVVHNQWRQTASDPRSTFSSDVDTASYTTIRKFLNRHTLPPQRVVRIEEMVNYFRYGYAPPAANSPHPFRVHTEVAACPWQPGHQLVRIGIKGREVKATQRPNSNLVFLLDVSGSMSARNKLPLLKRAFRLLLNQLGENDRVAIVVYAGASGLALPSTPCDQKTKILQAMNRLRASGSTNAGAGIQLAYQIAVENYIEGGINRVILATDGDFNVGVSSRSALVQLIQKRAKSNVFLSVLGFGMNHSDDRLEALANKGNGQFAFIDSYAEAKKVLVDDLSGTLVTIAKDLKLQVVFDPTRVRSYRLLGYENRVMATKDFDDDSKDAGEVGAGHTVTAFYQVVPVGGSGARLATVKVRYKQPEGTTSKLLQVPVAPSTTGFFDGTQDFRFAASVVAFGMVLRSSPHKGKADYPLILEMAKDSLGSDAKGYRKELIRLVERARSLSR